MLSQHLTGKAKVSVPKKVGNYSLILKSEENQTISKNASGVDGKYYWARVKVQQFDISKLKASYVKDNKVINLETVPVPENSGSVFVLLDANMSVTNLIMANSQSTDAQILKASSESKFNTVTFDSTSILQIRAANRATDNEHKFNGVKSQTVYVDSVEADGPISNKIDVGVLFNESLKDVNLNKKTFEISTDATSDTVKGKWIPIEVQLLDATHGNPLESLLTIKGDDVLVQTTDSKNTVFLWINANGLMKKTCTITYTGTTDSEELTLEIELHNAAKPVIEAAYEGTDENSKGIVVDEKPTKEFNGGSWTVDVTSFKYAMKEIENPNGTPEDLGKWYGIKIKTQLPVESLLYDKDGVWAEIDPSMIVDENTLQIWVNNEDLKDNEAEPITKLANRWGNDITIGGTANGSNAHYINVKVKQTEETKVELGEKSSQHQIGASLVNDGFKYGKGNLLNGIEVVEPDLQTLSGGNTLNSNLKLGKGLTYGSAFSATKVKDGNEVNYTTITLPMSEVAKITVNKQPGKWMVFYLMLEENGNIDDKNGGAESGIIVDSKNTLKLLSQNTLQNGEKLVPVWINLTNPEVQKHIGKNSQAPEGTIDIHFGYTSTYNSKTIEEENVCKVNFIDNSKDIGDLEGKVAAPQKPKAPDMEELNKNETEKKKFYKEWLNPDDTKVNDADLEKFAKNMEIMEKATVSEPEVYGNTVYITVTADLNSLEKVNDGAGSEDKYLVPISFDISMLNSLEGSKYWFYSVPKTSPVGTITWKSSWDNGVDIIDNKFWNFTLYWGNVTENTLWEFYFTKSNDAPNVTDVKDLNKISYVHYIVQFKQS